MKIPATADLGLVELRNRSPLVVQLLPTGAVFALRHGPTLLSQLLPGPAEDGLFRLLLRWQGTAGGGWRPLVGPGLEFAHNGKDAATWTSTADVGLHCTAMLKLHPQHAAWAWRVRVQNTSAVPLRIDVLHAQDLGLADEGAVRNNEAYISQYIDFLPVDDDAFGWTILARQNQAMAGARHPWLALACATGAEAFCTDGWQFFGADHRLTGEPAAVRMASLPSKRLQYEFALGGLQSRRLEVAPGARGEIQFVGRFLADHPAASSPGDLAELRAVLPAAGLPDAAMPPAATAVPSLFVTAPWLHGDRPAESDWTAWFPGERRHEERDAAGHVQSFFHGEDVHVVARDKEAEIARPHGHVLCSGDLRWIDAGQLGLTCYAAGVFAAQAYLGNPGLARLLPVVRNALNLVRGGGQRVFVRRGGAWRQLGVPSAFVMTPERCDGSTGSGRRRWKRGFGARAAKQLRFWNSGWSLDHPASS